MKYCKKCGKEKEINCFTKNNGTKDGISNTCKLCQKEKRTLNKESRSKYIKEYRIKNLYHLRELERKSQNKEENKIKTSARRKERRIKYLEKDKEKSKKYYNSPRGRFSEYKRRAKRSGFNFELSFEQFVSFWKQNCIYCNGKIETVGIDRVDNTKGYFFNNCVSCCNICNKMKYTFNYGVWIKHLKKIIYHIENV